MDNRRVSQTGAVAHLHRSPNYTFSKVSTASVRLVAGLGVDGDVLDRDAEGRLVRKGGVMDVVVLGGVTDVIVLGGEVHIGDAITVSLPHPPHHIGARMSKRQRVNQSGQPQLTGALGAKPEVRP